MHAIDLADLRRMGMLQPGRVSALEWSRRGEKTGSIRIAAADDGVLLAYRVTGQDVLERVPFVYTTTEFGGRRAWFRCLAFMRRCRVLYALGYLSAPRGALHEVPQPRAGFAGPDLCEVPAVIAFPARASRRIRATLARVPQCTLRREERCRTAALPVRPPSGPAQIAAKGFASMRVATMVAPSAGQASLPL
jgi:hypothetical protein